MNSSPSNTWFPGQRELQSSGIVQLIAALGVFVAIPIKRQLINKEQLPFPTGTATAETIRTIHGASGGSQGTCE